MITESSATCVELQAVISRGTAPRLEEAQRLVRHAAQCTDCRELADRLAQLPAPADVEAPSSSRGAGFSAGPRYEIQRTLGRGAMGVVYEAFDRERGLGVALKTMRWVDGEHLLRFKREFRTLGALEHPNLVTLFDFASEQGECFFTMELVAGTPFDLYVSDRGAEHAGTLALGSHPTLPFRDAPASPPAGPAAIAECRCDEQRLRAGLLQVVAGLDALHRAGHVHRDIKPSNVLCTSDGRVVILDFGVVGDIDGEGANASSIVGTAAYMAPEQALGLRTGPAADWYAVGAMLYEVLTGRLPFSGSAVQMMLAKQEGPPVPPVTLASCDPELSSLCLALLARRPGERPGAEEIRGRLGDARDRRAPSSPTTLRRPFIGRAEELARLTSLFDASRRHQTVCVSIDGPSGIGKSALVAKFVRELSEKVPDLVVLTGTHHEHESMPFQVLDTMMDTAATYLARLPAGSADALLPLDAPLLAQHFPSLRSVKALQWGSYRPPAQDPQELRARLFGAVRELIARLAARRPLLLIIDDVQWSDADSRAAFEEALRGPSSPPMLVVLIRRSAQREEETDAWFARLGGARDRIHLAPLGEADALQLARTLLASQGTPADPGAIAGESAGHPLFIEALVRHSARHAEGPGAGVRLDEALRARYEELEAGARLLLELCALATTVLGERAAIRASGLDLAAFMRARAELKLAHLVRSTVARGEEALEILHDRVREVVASTLTGERRRDRHVALASALEATGPYDLEALFFHWREAGQRETAVRFGTLAAAKATEALAFEQAARHYRCLLELVDDGEARRRLVARHGEALANAGRGTEAAEAFRAAAAGAPGSEALELRRRAAEQLLRSGRMEEGLQAVQHVLSAVGLTYPATPRGALLRFLTRRAWLRLRGLGFRKRETDQVSPTELTRVDVCWSVAGVLGMVDTIRGANFQCLHLLLALRVGEPFRVARALALEAAYAATQANAKPRSDRLFLRADALAAGSQDPYLAAWILGAKGVAAVLQGDWDAGAELCKQGERRLRTECGNVAWELSSFQFFTVTGLAYGGRLRELSQRVPQCLREAEDRGDLYGAAVHRTALAALVWLARDDVATARQRAQWTRTGFQVEHFWELLADAQSDLYEGRGADALQRVSGVWGRLSSSLLLRVQLTRLEALQLRARVSLAAASEAMDGGRRRDLLRSARRDARRLFTDGAWATPWGHLISAGAAFLDGEPELAAGRLREAVAGLDARGFALYAAAARFRLGELIRGSEGAELVAAARAYCEREGIVRPERMMDVLAPGFVRAGGTAPRQRSRKSSTTVTSRASGST